MKYRCKKGVDKVLTVNKVYDVTYHSGVFLVKRDSGGHMKMSYDNFMKHFSVISGNDVDEDNFYFDK